MWLNFDKELKNHRHISYRFAATGILNINLLLFYVINLIDSKKTQKTEN
jgi:hypothetical protein